MKKTAIIRKDKYAIVKAKEKKDSWACIDDGREITLIIEQKKLLNIEKQKVQKDFKLITFDMVLPFNMVGFIANIANVLAEAKIPIFVISAYSTDHLFIKSKYLNRTLKQLQSLGFKIKIEK